MAEQNEKHLKPLKEICQKLVVDKECVKHVEDLRKLTGKGAFYEYYVFVELLEVLSKNPQLPKSKVKEVLQLLSELLREESSNKDSIINRLYNFVIKHKVRYFALNVLNISDVFDLNFQDRPELVERFIAICSFKKEPKTSKAENLFLTTEVLLRLSPDGKHRNAMFNNYRLHLEAHGRDENLCFKLLQSISRSINIFTIEKKWSDVEMFLNEILIPAVDKEHLNIANKESSYDELLNIFSMLGKCGHAQTNVMTSCERLAKVLNNVLTKEDWKKCNSILMNMFNICSQPNVNISALKDFHSSHYKNTKETKSGCLLHEKTTILVAKMFTAKLQQLEVTLECFSAYHQLVISLFHVFKSIKNKEGVTSCCTDVKRHEIHNLSATIFVLAVKFVNQGKFSKPMAKDLLYHVSYDTQLCSGLKCQSKDREMLNTYSRIYHVLYEFNQKPTMIPDNLNVLHECIKSLFNLWNDISDEVKASSTAPDILAWRIYENPTNKEIAAVSANGMASMIINRKLPSIVFTEASKDDKKSILKHMFSLREATKLLGFTSATEFIQSKQFSIEKVGTIAQIPIAEIILIELCALFRYHSEEDLETIVMLFKMLCTETKDPTLLSMACQNITDEVVKKMDVAEFKKINKLLEQNGSEKFDVEIALSLALNYYAIYFTTAESIAEEIKNITTRSVTMLQVQRELELLGHLNESLNHFTDVVCHLMKNKADVDKILSMRRVLSILNNMGVQYYIRGIKYKDLETFTLLWNLIILADQSKITLLTIGTFFLDHRQLLVDLSGNYIKISKKIKHLTIEEIVATSNNILDEQFIPAFSEQTSSTQCTIWSYMLSLWVYYLSQGRKTDGFKRWDQFHTFWKCTEASDDSENRETIQSKIYFSLMEINLNCCSRSADNFLSLASGTLMRVKKISRDFMYHFNQIYYRITLEALNYSINRLADMNHYDTVMMSLISAAYKKGYYLKLLDLLSLSIQRNLNMEKVDNAKVNIAQ